MSAYMNYLRSTSYLIDVKVSCGDMTFEGHKIILALNSSYLKKLFEEQMEKEVTITLSDPNCTPMAVMSLLNFIYTKEIDFTNDRMSLLAAAHFLNMNVATEEIIEQIISNINIPIFLKEWNAIRKYGDSNHQNKMIKSLAKNFESLIGCDQFLKLTRDELISILKLKNQLPSSTDIVIQGILKWILHKKKRRATYLSDMLSLIDVKELPWISIANLNEEDPVIANNLFSILCKKIWQRDEVLILIFGPDDKVGDNARIPLHFLDPITNSWLSIDRKLPRMMLTEGTVCNWKNYIYSITKTSITVYNIETDCVSKMKAELSSYEQHSGSLAAIENVLYYALKNRLEKYDLKSHEKTWISLPTPLFDFVNPAIFYNYGFLYIINDNLLIQQFEPITKKWHVIDALKIKNYSGKFLMYEKSGMIYMFRNNEPDILRILNLESKSIEIKNLDSSSRVAVAKLIFVEELKPGLLKLLLLDSTGNQWSRMIDSVNFNAAVASGFSTLNDSNLLDLECLRTYSTEQALNSGSDTSCENMSSPNTKVQPHVEKEENSTCDTFFKTPLEKLLLDLPDHLDNVEESDKKSSSFIRNNQNEVGFIYSGFHGNVKIKSILTTKK